MKMLIHKNFEFSELERKEVEKYVEKKVRKGYVYAETNITTSEDAFPRYLATLTRTKEVKL